MARKWWQFGRAKDEEIAEARQAGKLEAYGQVAEAFRGYQVGAGVNPTGAGYATVPYSYPQVGGSPRPLYGYDRPIWYATPNSPRRRPDSLVSVDLIRQFADNYDILRSCILQHKREMEAQPFAIVARDPQDESTGTQKRIAEATQFFTRKGGLGLPTEDRRLFEGKLIEDLDVLGCYAMWKGWSLGGHLQEVLIIDAATIRPRMDAYGWPGPNEVWYEQWIMGMKVRDFKALGMLPAQEYKVASFKQDELIYDGLWPMSYSPWFRSPVEYLITTVMAALASDKWNRSWLTTGDTPSDVWTCPPEWTPEQCISYAEYFMSMLAGNTEKRRQTKFYPGGPQASKATRKDQDFEKFDLWLARRTGAVMGVQLASIGFTGEQYKESQENSTSGTTRLGIAAHLQIRNERYNEILEEIGYGDLQINDREDASETPLEQANRLSVLVQNTIWTPNRARKELGDEPHEDGDVLLVPAKVSTLESVVNPPEPVAPVEPGEHPEDGEEEDDTKKKADIGRWRSKALARLQRGQSALVAFDSAWISLEVSEAIREGLAGCSDAASVRALFARFL